MAEEPQNESSGRIEVIEFGLQLDNRGEGWVAFVFIKPLIAMTHCIILNSRSCMYIHCAYRRVLNSPRTLIRDSKSVINPRITPSQSTPLCPARVYLSL